MVVNEITLLNVFRHKVEHPICLVRDRSILQMEFLQPLRVWTWKAAYFFHLAPTSQSLWLQPNCLKVLVSKTICEWISCWWNTFNDLWR